MLASVPPQYLHLVCGFILAALANLLMANSERRPPEFYLRLNNSALAGLTAVAVCDIMVKSGVFPSDFVMPFCVLIGLMADAKIYKVLAASWLGSVAERHGFRIPDRFRDTLKPAAGGHNEPKA